jgi:anti-anti-sigma factor
MEPQQPDGGLVVERRDDAVVARFTCEVVLSGLEADAVGAGLRALVAEPDLRPLLVDFGNVRSLSSLMLGHLIGLRKAAEAAGVRLALFNLRPDVRGILEVTGLTVFLRLHANETEALQGP